MMQNINFLSIASYFILGMCLLGLEVQGAIAQSPSPMSPPQEPSNSPDSAPPSAAQIQFFPSMTPSPIVPACPFPAISLSSTANQALGSIFEVGHGEVYPGESFSSGDGSDADLGYRVLTLAGEGKLDEAMPLAQRIRDPRLQVEALLRVARGYANIGQPNRAFEIVQSVPDITEPTFYSRENVLSDIVSAYREQGQLEQALRVAEQMGEGRGVILREIARDYAAQGQPEKAVELLSQAVTAFRTTYESSTNADEQIVPAPFRFMILSIFASDYLELNQNDQAVELLDEVLANAQALSEVPFFLGYNILSSLPVLYRDAGQESKAIEAVTLVREIAERYQQPMARSMALSQIALIYLALQQPEQATTLLTQAEAVAKADQTASQENIVWVNLARGYAVLGQYDKAFQSIAAIQPASLRDQVNQALVCSQESR